jgi:SpoVK/Ycf46/Vps4 family AAA+-type ATPase
MQAPFSPDVALHHAEAGSLERLVLAEPVRERLSQWSLNLRERRTVPVLVVAGSAGSGKTTAAVAACGEAGLAVVEVRAVAEALDARLRLARREARWYDAALLVKIDPQAAESMDWRVLWKGIQQVRTPLLLELDSRTVEAAAAPAPHEPVVVALEEPGLELRIRMWQSLLPRGEQFELSELERLAAAFRFPPGRISRAIRRAQAEMAALPAGQRRLTAASLENACRGIGSAAMGPLAQKLSLPYQMKDLVVQDTVRAELGLAVAWVRHQRQVLEAWGFARRIPFGKGLTALFSGPPGTGKTMAAQVLARELGLDIYRIDLSRVMSKYIGETEKNLARLFDEAHAAGVILFFDEADAIFGKRTEVRDAHDRYANVEIGYLLQRMEEHEGVTILATNRMRDMDEAFIRRFHFILNFPMPGEPDRLKIWQGMFPSEAEREANLDLRPLARHFEISGGEIRNVVLAAAFFAAAGNSRIDISHVKRALRRELGKNGRVVDERALAAI